MKLGGISLDNDLCQLLDAYRLRGNNVEGESALTRFDCQKECTGQIRCMCELAALGSATLDCDRLTPSRPVDEDAKN